MLRHPPDELSELLDVALDSICRPAFVVSSSGMVVRANGAGREWLARDPRRLAGLVAAVRTRSSRLGLRIAGATRTAAHALVVRCGVGEVDTVAERARAYGFTAREQEICTLLLDGTSNRAIATRLNISHRTVEKHLTSMFAKAGVDSRHALHVRVCAP